MARIVRTPGMGTFFEDDSGMRSRVPDTVNSAAEAQQYLASLGAPPEFNLPPAAQPDPVPWPEPIPQTGDEWIDQGDGWQLNTRTGERRPGGVTGGLLNPDPPPGGPPSGDPPPDHGPYTVPGQENVPYGQPGNVPVPTDEFWGQFEDLDPIPQLGGIELGPNPEVARQYGSDFDQWYSDVIDAQSGKVGDFYNNLNVPTMEAAGHRGYEVPEWSAQTPESFDELQFLLSGQGFDPATRARMAAQVTDESARLNAAQRGAARISAEQAGQAGGGGLESLEAQINRQTADQLTQALNQQSIEDAYRGLENRRMGTGMELGRRTDTAGMQNQAAIDNASRLFSAMSQNVANQQQANAANFGLQGQQQLNKASEQAATYRPGAQAYNTAALGKAAEADASNVQNEINRRLNQAQLNRDQQRYNIGLGEGRYAAAFNFLGNQAGGANPYQFVNAPNYNPNFIRSDTVSRVGQDLYDPQTGGAS